jgi:hypothetical protein
MMPSYRCAADLSSAYYLGFALQAFSCGMVRQSDDG